MRYAPSKRSELYPMMSAFDKFFESFWEDEQADENVRMMAVDLIEQEDKYLVKADLPGFEKQDINISIDKNNLVIEANHSEKKEEKEESYYRCERYSGNYRRVISLSEKCKSRAS
ncbi:MAG: Hsp20/alpha crystallin family protein [Candidatus Cloacimonadales bacterium]